ncbi:MAG: hypothetical protein VX223_07435, partial [Myxococcota bacterium]|nr:hypothetical protein [Myxococcota bacterium]
TGVNIQDKVRAIAEARGHAMLLGSIERAMADKKFPEALALASRIPASSPYRVDVDTLVRGVKKAQAPAEMLVDTTSAQGKPDMPPEELATDAVMGFFDAITSGDTELQKTLPSLLVTEADCVKAPTAQQDDCVRSVAARSTLVEQWVKEWKGKALNEMTAPEPVTDRSEWGGIKIWTLKLTLEGLDPVDLFVLQLSRERFAMWFPVDLPAK